MYMPCKGAAFCPAAFERVVEPFARLRVARAGAPTHIPTRPHCTSATTVLGMIPLERECR